MDQHPEPTADVVNEAERDLRNAEDGSDEDRLHALEDLHRALERELETPITDDRS